MNLLQKVINFEIDIGKNEHEGDNTTNDQKLQQLIAIAEERCPAIYSMSHIIKVSAKLK